MRDPEVPWIVWVIVWTSALYFLGLFCWWLANGLGFTEAKQGPGDDSDDSDDPVDFDTTNSNEPMWHNEQPLPKPQPQQETTAKPATKHKEPLW